MKISDNTTDYIRAISPYVPGKPVADLAREFGLDEAQIIKLASNENPAGPGPKALAAIARAASELTRYPDGSGFELKATLAARNRVGAEQIVLGNGSNDILELLAHVFLRPGKSAVYAQHSFAVYPLATQAFGAIGIEVPARDFGHDLTAMRAAIRDDTGIVWLANPNNPTGTWLPPADVKAFVATVPRAVLVVLDEAYNEYLQPDQQADTASWLAEFPNLVLSRTFSKAYGLAALRIGYGLMHADAAAMLNRVRQPFNVNAFAQAAAIAALDDVEYVGESCRLNSAGMRQLEQGFVRLGLDYIPSHANFICVRIGDAAAVNLALLRRGIIVRPVANYGMPEYLRVTIGTAHENDRFLIALGEILAR
ncbi:MAG: histidinol-phosphate transaminase [Betaproteobacteria bacterium]